MNNEINQPFSGGPDPLLRGVEQLGNLNLSNDKARHYVSIQTERGGGGQISGFKVSHEPHQKYFGRKIVEWIKKFIWGNYHVNDLKEAKALFEAVLAKVKTLSKEDPLREQYKTAVEKAFKNLNTLFEQNRLRNTEKGLIYKSDILEAVSVAVKDEGLNKELGMNVERVKATSIEEVRDRKLKTHMIPVFRMEDRESVMAIMQKEFPDKKPTLQQLYACEALKPYMMLEKVAAGYFVRHMYRHKKAGRALDNKFISEKLTTYLGERYRKEMPKGLQRTTEILTFFKGSGITPYSDEGGELYSYREMFEKEFRDEISCDEAFQRNLNPQAVARRVEKAVRRCLEKPVISNSDCRLRLLPLQEGQVKTAFTIDGKVIQEGDSRFFTIQSMLGNETDVDTSFSKQNPAIVPQTIQQADQLYLNCLTNAVNRKKGHMVVQRLAPVDIHHYAAPAKGKVLSLKEACERLKKDLDKKQDKEEIAQLDALIAFYDYGQNKSHSEEAMVRVQGTHQMSVSTLATQSASPLTQNDRKIVVMEHQNGSISVHTYIGAIGVNNVKVTQQAGGVFPGQDAGSMGFGNDEEGREGWQKMATREDSVNLRKGARVVDPGNQEGVFDKNGSTVVSLYFGLNPDESLVRAGEALRYMDDQGVERVIELQAHMGDVIGTLT